MKKFFAAMLTLAGVLAVVSASHADTRRPRDPGVNAAPAQSARAHPAGCAVGRADAA